MGCFFFKELDFHSSKRTCRKTQKIETLARKVTLLLKFLEYFGNCQSKMDTDHCEPLLDDTSKTQEMEQPDLEDLIYRMNSFAAVLWPVVITMVVSSLIACNVQDQQTKQNMRSYLYYKNIEQIQDSKSMKTLMALVNALCIIAVIATITFLVVFLYKYNCMKGLTGYLIMSSSILLGLVGSVIVKNLFCNLLGWQIDVYSMTFVMYNFAVVGTTSIFYQKGIPQFVEQGYLISTSVIMAWQLCQWPEWSVWTILCMLAFWDLFAVLSPCGPLKWLVNLITAEGRPMPGLLYEADVHDSHIAEHHDIELIDLKSTKRRHPYESLEKFQSQLLAFYNDFNPSNIHQVEKLAEFYVDNQEELWSDIYRKYHVQHVPKSSIYPAVSVVTQLTKCRIPKEKNTIKLGLGDFIFYSVLVGRSAMHGFPVFVACFVCILVGLGITFYLLSWYTSLPALPIPILLSIFVFLIVRFLTEPFILFSIQVNLLE